MRKSIFVGCCILGIYAIYGFEGLNMKYNFTFLSELQELCPYTSFCEENARISLPENETKQPCCRSCSCKPECEMFGNCCFDYVKNGKMTKLRQCLSPVVTDCNANEIHYIMVYACLTTDGNDSMCPFTTTNVSSFAPVVSITTGEIYVNQQCADCNNVTDGVSWQLSVKCPFFEEDYFIASSDILLESHSDEPACYLTYIPPANVNVESRECTNDVIRQCNVREGTDQWTPMWEYCPMFNATYTYSSHNYVGLYGNIFCFICNVLTIPDPLCRWQDFKKPLNVPFSAILDRIGVEGSSVSKERDISACDASSVMVNSFEIECRQVICPLGQFRIGEHCGYYSKKWFGRSFTVLLKLTPLHGTPKIELAFVFQSAIKNDPKSSWLQRNAMRTWNIEVLYKPTANGKYVEYFVILASYPFKSVNPKQLQVTIEQALKEIWFVENNSVQSKFNVELNRYHKYQYLSREKFSSFNITIGQPYGYGTEQIMYQESKSDIENGILFDAAMRKGQNIMMNAWFINELFFCKQIELNDDEYDLSSHTVFFKVTNKTLYASDYIKTITSSVRVCLNQFSVNDGHFNSRNIYLEDWIHFISWLLTIANAVW
ncbi:hypothetical protein ACF0H5_008794 [Mactra antiquata]